MDKHSTDGDGRLIIVHSKLIIAQRVEWIFSSRSFLVCRRSANEENHFLRTKNGITCAKDGDNVGDDILDEIYGRNERFKWDH